MDWEWDKRLAGTLMYMAPEVPEAGLSMGIADAQCLPDGNVASRDYKIGRQALKNCMGSQNEPKRNPNYKKRKVIFF